MRLYLIVHQGHAGLGTGMCVLRYLAGGDQRTAPEHTNNTRASKGSVLASSAPYHGNCLLL